MQRCAASFFGIKAAEEQAVPEVLTPICRNTLRHVLDDSSFQLFSAITNTRNEPSTPLGYAPQQDTSVHIHTAHTGLNVYI